MTLTILSTAVFCINKLSLSVRSSKYHVFELSAVIVWGFSGGPCITPLFKGAHPHALAVIADSVAHRVQCHSSTISVGTYGKGGAFHIRLAG